jgi:4-phospho-D-threonate 3-dehydrogenase / 4-phospho-D-erythronate 3-dehydrogenase
LKKKNQNQGQPVPKIGITLGDPAGIGPEVALHALDRLQDCRCIPVLIGRQEIIFSLYRGALQGKRLEVIDENTVIDSSCSQTIYLYNVVYDAVVPDIGKGTLDTARESKAYIDAAIQLWKNSSIDAIVTGPVNKGLIEKSGTPFMGHTEYIAAQIGESTPYMMMFSTHYRVLLVTTHYSIEKLPGEVTGEKIYNTIKTGYQSIKKIDGKEPRLAVTGLDPHCGDNGAIGDFDQRVTQPALERARAEGIDVSGPYSADTLFLPQKWSQFDLVIAHYHDQGLIPFKILAFESGVNVTLGLSMIRSSVDHGTAYDIAGKGIASSSSMVEAIRLASRLIAS